MIVRDAISGVNASDGMDLGHNHRSVGFDDLTEDVMKIMLVVLIAGSMLVPSAGMACDLVNAWTNITGLTVGSFIHIGDRQGSGSQNCYGSLPDRYYAAEVDSCEDSANLFSGIMEGDDLSGVYEVRVIGLGGCIKLCACSP
jgi:hypothetical protein